MGLIPEEIISQVLERTDIVETISSYIPLKRAGRNFKANCPFHHEKTPSFVVNPDKQIYHCFGCGIGGNVISFLMNHDHVDFPEAVQILAQKSGISIPKSDSSSRIENFQQQIFSANEAAAEYYHQILLAHSDPDAKAARNYLKERGITLEMVKKFKLGFSLDTWDGLISFLKTKNIPLGVMEKAGLVVPKESKDGFYDRFRNRIMFPISDIRKRYLGFGGRSLKDGTAKYINSPETSVYTKGNHLYGFHLAKDSIVKKDSIVIVEGYMDFITPFQNGIDNVVASLGTALTTEQVRLIRRYTENIILLFDADQAGESAMMRIFDMLMEEKMIVRIAVLNQKEDPDSFIRHFGVEAFLEKIQNAISFFDFRLNFYKSKFGADSPEGKTRIIKELLPSVAKMDDAVMRFEHIKKLGNSLLIPEDVIVEELKKISVKSEKPEPQKQKPVEEISRTVERKILKLILDDQELIPVVKSGTDLNYFQDASVRLILAKIFELLDEGKVLSTQNLIGFFKDSIVQQKISSLITSEESFAGDNIKMLNDCISRLKEDHFKGKREEIRNQIRLAEMSGDHIKLNELKEKFNQLIKR